MERPKLAHRRHQPKHYTSPPADADYRPCIVMDIVQPNVQKNCRKLLRTFSSIGDPIGVHLGRSEKAHGRRVANDSTTPFSDDDYRYYIFMVIGQLIQMFKHCFNYHTVLELNAEFYCCTKWLLLPAESVFCSTFGNFIEFDGTTGTSYCQTGLWSTEWMSE